AGSMSPRRDSSKRWPTILAACAAPWACRCCANGKAGWKKPSASLPCPGSAGGGPRDKASTPSWLPCATTPPLARRGLPGKKRKWRLKRRWGLLSHDLHSSLPDSIRPFGDGGRRCSELRRRRRALHLGTQRRAEAGALFLGHFHRPQARPIALLHLRNR